MSTRRFFFFATLQVMHALLAVSHCGVGDVTNATRHETRGERHKPTHSGHVPLTAGGAAVVARWGTFSASTDGHDKRSGPKTAKATVTFRADHCSHIHGKLLAAGC